MSPYSPIPPIPDPGLSHPPGRSRGQCPLLAIRPLTTRRQVSMLSETVQCNSRCRKASIIMYRLQYDADVEKHPTGLGRLYGPRPLRAPPFLSPEIVRLSAAFSRLLTCVFSVHTSYYMTWATCGFRWHASGHRLATGMHP